MRPVLFGALFGLVGIAALLASPSHAWASSPKAPTAAAVSSAVSGSAAATQAAAQAATAIKSYREWKTSRISEAATRLESAKRGLEARTKDPNLAKTKSLEGRDTEVARLETLIRHEQMALENAQDLSVSDYFAGYLTKLSDKNAAFKEVAGKLSAEEVAELMSAYANSVFDTQTGRLPPSAHNLSPETVK